MVYNTRESILDLGDTAHPDLDRGYCVRLS